MKIKIYKATHTTHFSITFFLEFNFIVKPQGLRVLPGEIWQCICVFCNSLFISQMALSINIYFSARPNSFFCARKICICARKLLSTRYTQRYK